MFEIGYTSVIILLMIVALAREWFQPAGIVFAALLLLLAGRIISVNEAFAGFSNKGMLTVGFLFVVSAALQSSGTFERFVLTMLGNRHKSVTGRYLRLMLPVASLSAFLNNTPIVATLIPMVKSWAKRNNLAVSKFLIPLSYAAILGGTCTLIGTSTNLVVHGLLLEAGLDGFTFFEITRIGVPVALLSILFLTFIGRRLLPDRKDVITELGENTREFVVELKVGDEYPYLGQSLEQANLRHLTGLFLFQIERQGQIIAPVSPREKIYLGDRLFFTGLTETIYELQKTPGLYLVKDQQFKLGEVDSDRLKTYEAVISNTSHLIGDTVRNSGFRSHYNAVILAIHRSSERIAQKIGDIVLQPNDTLFLLAPAGFENRWYHSRDFTLVTPSLDVYSKPKWKGNLALGILAAMIVAAATGLIPIIFAAAIAAVLMVATNIISAKDAQNAVAWDILLLIAASFGIAKAIGNSGLAELVGNALISGLSGLGETGILIGIFILTSSFTLLITNNAAAAIVFPIALSVTQTLNLNPQSVMLTLALAASTCFASPIGYQTNLMVYSAGNYRFKDFLRIGLPMNVFMGVCVIIAVSVFLK